MKKIFLILAIVFSIGLLVGCGRVEVEIKVSEDATIPQARLAVVAEEYRVFEQIKKIALSQYQELPPEEKEYVEIQEKSDTAPYVVAWLWKFPDQEKAQEFTQQFLGKSATLEKEQDLIILSARLKGEELEEVLSDFEAGAAKPFLGSINLILRTYMPGEVVSFVEGEANGKVWQQSLNLGVIYREKPDIVIEVIAREQ